MTLGYRSQAALTRIKIAGSGVNLKVGTRLLIIGRKGDVVGATGATGIPGLDGPPGASGAPGPTGATGPVDSPAWKAHAARPVPRHTA